MLSRPKTHSKRLTPRADARLRIEELEPRLPLAGMGDEILVNDLVIRVQTAANSAQAIAEYSAFQQDNLVIAFEGKGPVDDAGVFAELHDTEHNVVLSTFRVNSTIRGEQHSPAVAAGEFGFVIVWAGRGPGDKSGVFFQRFDVAGNPLGTETLANETRGGDQLHPAVAMAADGSFAIAWSGVGTGDVSGVYVRWFDANGVPLGGEQLVNTTVADHQTKPSMVFDSAGKLAVAWQSRHQDGSDWGIFARWFESDGTPHGDEFLLNATTSQSQSEVHLAAGPFDDFNDDDFDGENTEVGIVTAEAETNGGGAILAGWQSYGQDGESWTAVARRFDHSGPLADEVQLNDSPEGHQVDVVVGVQESGDWLASWSNGVPDGSGWEVAAKTFDSNGTPGPWEFVNHDLQGPNSGHQHAPSLVTGNGHAAITWSGAGLTDHYGVWYRDIALAMMTDPQLPPVLDPIPDRIVDPGTAIQILFTANDPNPLDLLTILLDQDNVPDGVIVEQLDNNTAGFLWIPSTEHEGLDFPFFVVVTDDGVPPLSDAEEFTIFVRGVGGIEIS